MKQSRTAGVTICLAAALAAAPAVAAAQIKIAVPIMLGGNDLYDACAGAGVVSKLNPRGSGFLSVRSGPGRSYAEMDRIYGGNAVHVCDSKRAWTAIVYGGDGRDCGVGRPWTKRLAYTGPCKYGWVSSRYVTVTAG
jgi:uncharacterized protein YgiM (DUF1202 family)